MKNLTPSPILWFVLRIFLGFIFLYAGFSKLIEPIENFQGNIASYEIIPYAAVSLIAAILPWIEVICGLFLMLGYGTQGCALCLAGLSAGFMGLLLVSGSLFGPEAKSCGCFGETGFVITIRQVFFLDFINVFIGLALFCQPPQPWSLDRLFGGSKASLSAD